MENTTLVSTRALLLILKNLDNNAKLDHKTSNATKAKRTEGKCMMELINSCIPKKPKKVG